MTAILRVEARDVHGRLSDLGVTEQGLSDAVRRGYLAYSNCTANHPPLIPGIWAWGETVRALREYLLPLGWTRSDEDNYSLVINPSGEIAIAVATGDEETGRAEASPSTKAPKGPNTIDAIAANQLQLNLFAESPPFPAPARSSDARDEKVTWILLIYRATSEVRCELSLPSSIGTDGRIDGWRERILLGSIPLDSEFVEVARPALPDITVDVKRRA